MTDREKEKRKSSRSDTERERETDRDRRERERGKQGMRDRQTVTSRFLKSTLRNFIVLFPGGSFFIKCLIIKKCSQKKQIKRKCNFYLGVTHLTKLSSSVSSNKKILKKTLGAQPR